MESIGRLRKYLSDMARSGLGNDARNINYIIGDIEAEIADKYMLLPLDADGVPIHPRDEVDTSMGEKGPIGHLEYWYPNHWVAVIEYKPGQFTRYDPAAISHVKPRTIEDVLREMLDAYDKGKDGDMPYSFIADYADELRQMGVGE